MVEITSALRRAGPLASHQPVSITSVAPMTRLSARGGAEAAARFGRAFGVDLSPVPLRANVAEPRAALWLGPDEWLLFAPEDTGLARAIEAALDGEPGCIVDVSHRQAGLHIGGEGADAVLNAGCPLDLGLKVFPVGMCTRTLLGKADVVLWRREPDLFHLEAWRSFTPYVMSFLRRAAGDCGFHANLG
jgi:sarcosine oxidase subunit gamma